MSWPEDSLDGVRSGDGGHRDTGSLSAPRRRQVKQPNRGGSRGQCGWDHRGVRLTTVAGGWWAYYLQQRAWAQQNDVRLLEDAIDRAGAACQHITSLLDRRLYRMQRLTWAATGGSADIAADDELERRRQDYVELLYEWHDHLNTNLSLIGTYFGGSARDSLDQLYEDFRRVGVEVQALVRAARSGEDATKRGAALAYEFERRSAGSLNGRVHSFGVTLMGQLREGQVGRAAPDKLPISH